MELTQKTNLMTWLFLPKNETLLKILEEQRSKEIIANYEASLKPMTKEELVERALKSEADIKAGKVMSQEEFEIESDNW